MATSASSLWRHGRTLLTAQVSVAASMLIGDTACQYIARDEKHPPPSSAPSSSPLPSVAFLSPYLPSFLNPDRSLVMLLTGALVTGPWSFTTLSAAEYLFPGRAMRAVLSKVAMNGLIAPVGITLSFSTITLLEGKGWTGAQQKVKGDLGATWLTGALYWPFISALNFRFVPFTWRPLFSGIAGAGTSISDPPGNPTLSHVSLTFPPRCACAVACQYGLLTSRRRRTSSQGVAESSRWVRQREAGQQPRPRLWSSPRPRADASRLIAVVDLLRAVSARQCPRGIGENERRKVTGRVVARDPCMMPLRAAVVGAGRMLLNSTWASPT